MKRLILFLLLSAVSCFGQGGLTRIQRFCEIGGRKAVTQGLNSTNNIQESFPLCQVSVYTHGTQTLANIFLDNLSVPTPMANPFTADTNGKLGFYAGPGCYDIVTSGGQANDQFPQPFTYADVCIQQGGGGGPNIQCPNALNGSLTAWIDPNNLGCDTQAGTDFVGDIFGQSFRALGPTNGFIGLEGAGLDPILNEDGFVYFLGADTVPVPYTNKVPGLQGTNGNALGIISQTGTVNTLGWLTVGGFPELKVNGTDLLNCTGIQCPEQNLIAGSGMTITNGSGGDVTLSSGGGGNPCPDVNAIADIWVDPSGNDSTGNGSNGNPYQHISRAIVDISAIVCQRYIIHLKTAGTYDIGPSFQVDLSGHVWYGGGMGGFGGNANGANNGIAASNWPWETDDGGVGTVTGTWVEIVGQETPGDGSSDPNSFVLDAGGGGTPCSGNTGISVANGFLVLRGLQVTGASWGVIANRSTVQLAGVVFLNDCIGIDAGNHSIIKLDSDNQTTGAWSTGGSFVYFAVTNNSANPSNYWMILTGQSLITDEESDYSESGSFGEIVVNGSKTQAVRSLIRSSHLDLTLTGFETGTGEIPVGSGNSIGVMILEQDATAALKDLGVDCTNGPIGVNGLSVSNDSGFIASGTNGLRFTNCGVGASVDDGSVAFGQTTASSGNTFLLQHQSPTGSTAGGIVGGKSEIGTVSVSASTSGTATFSHSFASGGGAYSSTICELTPIADPTTIGGYWVSSDLTTVTANVHTSGTITFNYSCAGVP